MIQYLKEIKIEGINTNKYFLISVLQNKNFVDANDNTKFIEILMKYKMLVVKAEEQVIRLFPALIVSKKEIDEAISKIDKTCKEMS